MNPILTHIRIKAAATTEQQVFLKPEDFGLKSVILTLTNPHQRREHAVLRVTGYSALESFAASFGAALRGTPELFDRAAVAYEKTAIFADEVDELIEVLDPAAIDMEHDARIAELSSLAGDAAMGIRASLAANYFPATEKMGTDLHINQYHDVVKLRAEEIETERAMKLHSAVREELEKGVFDFYDANAKNSLTRDGLRFINQ
jgi:hypothetical protein